MTTPKVGGRLVFRPQVWRAARCARVFCCPPPGPLVHPSLGMVRRDRGWEWEPSAAMRPPRVEPVVIGGTPRGMRSEPRTVARRLRLVGGWGGSSARHLGPPGRSDGVADAPPRTGQRAPPHASERAPSVRPVRDAPTPRVAQPRTNTKSNASCVSGANRYSCKSLAPRPGMGDNGGRYDSMEHATAHRTTTRTDTRRVLVSRRRLVSPVTARSGVHAVAPQVPRRRTR